MSSFKKAFADARKKQGAGGTFKWNGKSYSTNYAEEEKKTAPKSSPRPKAAQGAKGVDKSPQTIANIKTREDQIALEKSSPRPRARPSGPSSSPRPKKRAAAAAQGAKGVDKSPQTIANIKTREDQIALEKSSPRPRARPRARSSVSAAGSSPRPMPTGAVARTSNMSFNRPEVIDRRATKVLATAAPRVAATPVKGKDVTNAREGRVATSRVMQALRAFTGRGGMSDR